MKTELTPLSELQPGDKLFFPWPKDQQKLEWHKLPEVVTIKKMESGCILIEESGGLSIRAVEQKEFEKVVGASEAANLIKVCINPNCDAVFHNCKKSNTHCIDCNGKIIVITEKTFVQKYAGSFFQYDYQTKKFYRKSEGHQTALF